MANFTLEDVRQRTYKARDAWWTVLLVDPPAAHLVRLVANRTNITPNQLTVAALILGLGAGGCFAMATTPWLLVGALLFHLAFTLDCMDGKIARLKGTGSIFGAWLDYIFDRVRVLACAIALMGGQYLHTGNVAYVWAALGVVFLDMLRYMDALEIYKVRSTMRGRLQAMHDELDALHRAANGGLPPAAEAADAELRSAEGALGRDPEADMEDRVVADSPSAVGSPRAAALGEEFEKARFDRRYPWYARIRTALMRGRIRPHLISGIEFQMGVFIVAPVAAAVLPGAIIPVTMLSGAGLLAFELVVIYKFWLSSRDYARVLADLERKTAEATAAAGRPAANAAVLGSS